MRLLFTARAWRQYSYWIKADQARFERLNELIEEVCRHPFTGTGKPEPLKRNLKGFWSRRIDLDNRLVYRVGGSGEDQTLEIVQCRFHYEQRKN